MTVEHRAAATSLAGFVVLGLPAGAIGVAWPQMRTELSAPLAGLGILLALFTVAYFGTAILTGLLVERLGGGIVLQGSALLSAASLLVFFATRSWWLVLIASLVWGAACGPFDAGINAYVTSRGVRLMGWLHAAWGAGAALGPPLVLLATTRLGSWRFAFLAIAAAFIAIAVLARPIGEVWRLDAREPAGPSAARGRRPLLWTLVGFFFVYVGLETCAGQWGFTQLTLSRGLDSAAAATGVSLYWAALALGRAGLGTAGHRFAPRVLLDACLIVALAGTLVFWLAPARTASLVGLPLLGLGLSTIFPLLLVLTPERFEGALVVRVIGYQMAAGVGGGGLVPVALGAGIEALGGAILGPALVAMALGQLLLHRLARQLEVPGRQGRREGLVR